MNPSAGSPVSTLFLKQSTSFEFSSLSPVPEWLMLFQSGTEETFKHAAPLPCLPVSAQSRIQPCSSAQVRPRFMICIAARLPCLKDYSLKVPWFLYIYIYIFCLLAAQSGAEPNTLLSAWGQQHRLSSSGSGSAHGNASCSTGQQSHGDTHLPPKPFPSHVLLTYREGWVLFPVPTTHPMWRAGSSAAGQFFQVVCIESS